MHRIAVVFSALSFSVIFAWGQSSVINHWESVILSDTVFRYWDSNRGAANANWRNTDFNDASWPSGKGGIGYGDNDDGTVINACVSVFMRVNFTVRNIADIGSAFLFIDYDDAFVAYLNGTEIARSAGLTAPFPAYDQVSSAQHEVGTREKFEISKTTLQNILLTGKNTLALQVHNATANSTDLSSNTWLIAGITAGEKLFLPVPSWFTEPVTTGFSSSNLPFLVIHTDGYQTIPDEPKIPAHLGMIYNGPGERNHLIDPFNHYDGSIGIEMRGNSSQNFPKKPYNFETRDPAGGNLNVPILGMPQENDWSLIASYLDHSYIRNLLASHLSLQTGRWASRGRLVEVVLNDEYQGIYILMEKIKRDKNRLNIATLNPDEIFYPDITGGYIYEVTGFGNNLGQSRNLKYPDPDEAAPEQIAYIRQYDDNFRSIMLSVNFKDETTGYPAWIDVESFVDEMMVQEAMRNSDAYGWSAYFHKDKNGKLNAGPVWDFDQSSGNSSYPDNGVVTGWLFSHTATNNTPFFWKRLWEDPAYRYKFRLRWEELRKGPYRTELQMAYIDSIASLLSEAQAREFSRWPVLGRDIWRETSGFQQRNSYQKEVDYLKNFLTQRWAWMDTELAKVSNPFTSVPDMASGITNGKIEVYPNPAKDHLIFCFNTSRKCQVMVQIYDPVGKLVQNSGPNSLESGNNRLMLELDQNMKPGVYLFRVLIDLEPSGAGRFVKTD